MSTSRSGRLRKRSSKLTENESSEESDANFSPSKSSDGKIMKVLSPDIHEHEKTFDENLPELDDVNLKEEDWEIPDDNSFLGVKLDDDFREENLNIPAEEDFNFNDENFDLDEDSSAKEDSNSVVAQSLYFSEKQGTKKVNMKEGKKRKTERRDKGMTRFTAYMLWSREIRPALIEKHPELDFSLINKKLGEMWKTVPTAQKYTWRSRAKRYEMRIQQQNNSKETNKNNSKSKGKKKQSANVSASKEAKSKKNPPSKSKKNITPKGSHSKGSRASKHLPSPTKLTIPTASPANSAYKSAPAPNFKVTGNSPIDVASHMKLLGESLNNIGHKLKEHEGQIAVSGSLSVLLDSMLCVLGPLMCLTDQIEETKGAINPETHAKILDNIAYIMPGIV